jgi:selenoprotein W-related protein
MPRTPRVEITYCTQCRWLLRAAWMAQELLSTFAEELGEVALVPGTGGVFQIRIGDERLWDRAEQGSFPDVKELKQLVRDRVAPRKDLGHSDRSQPNRRITAGYDDSSDRGMRNLGRGSSAAR